MADELPCPCENGHFYAMLEKLMNSLRGKLDVSKDEHGIDLVALHIEEYFFVLLDNEPVTSLTEDGVLFGKIKVSHDCLFATEGTEHTEL